MRRSALIAITVPALVLGAVMSLASFAVPCPPGRVRRLDSLLG